MRPFQPRWPTPWWGRLGVRVTAALVVLGIISVGASLYLARLSVDYFDARIAETLEQSRRLAQEVEPVHRELIEAHIASFQARARVMAMQAQIAGYEASELERLRAKEPDVREIVLRMRGDTRVRAGRAPSAVGQGWQTYEVVAPVVEGEVELLVVFEIDPAIDRRYQALGERQRELGQQRSDQAELEAAAFYVIVGTGVLVLFVAIGAGVVVARATTRQVSALSRAMSRVGEGDLEVRAPEQGRDELAALAHAFNQMLDELAQAQRRVAYLQRIAVWQGMARRIAHEIKNPLTPIQLAVQQLRDKDPRTDARFSSLLRISVEIVEDEVEVLRRMVTSFSQFAKVPEVRAQPESLARILREFEQAYSHWGDEEGALEIEPLESDVIIAVDRQLLKQALVNLVENAVLWARKSSRGPAQVRMSVSLEAADSVLISVDDNGPGIDEDRRERVFEPYETSRKEGTGLGLAIVKKIVLDHGGEVWIEASPLLGARFVLRLRRASESHDSIGVMDYV